MNKDIQKISELLKTQDNRITSNPIFVVQQKRREYGFDDRYTDNFVWMDDDDSSIVTDEAEIKRLDEFDKRTGQGPDRYIKVGYKDNWEFVTACFTEQGCKDYIEANGHNLNEPRIYVELGYRNKEWELIREYFLKYEEFL